MLGYDFVLKQLYEIEPRLEEKRRECNNGFQADCTSCKYCLLKKKVAFTVKGNEIGGPSCIICILDLRGFQRGKRLHFFEKFTI